MASGLALKLSGFVYLAEALMAAWCQSRDVSQVSPSPEVTSSLRCRVRPRQEAAAVPRGGRRRKTFQRLEPLVLVGGFGRKNRRRFLVYLVVYSSTRTICFP